MFEKQKTVEVIEQKVFNWKAMVPNEIEDYDRQPINLI